MDNEVSQKNSDALVDEGKRRFLLKSTCVVGGVGALCALTPFVSSLWPSAKAKADAAPVEVDISHLQPGEQLTVAWQGKPVWIVRRTQAMIEQLKAPSILLRDPNSLTPQQPAYAQNFYRSIHPEYLVLIGICTHLGCSPKYKPNLEELGPQWPGGFFCPCHGSTFDLAGRVFKEVPAPINLAVPPYYFLTPKTLVIGEDKP